SGLSLSPTNPDNPPHWPSLRVQPYTGPSSGVGPASGRSPRGGPPRAPGGHGEGVAMLAAVASKAVKTPSRRRLLDKLRRRAFVRQQKRVRDDEARNALVELNIKLVYHVLRTLDVHERHPARDDLVQA